MPRYEILSPAEASRHYIETRLSFCLVFSNFSDFGFERSAHQLVGSRPRDLVEWSEAHDGFCIDLSNVSS